MWNVDLPSPDLWLVRTAKNVISGPFSREKVSELVRSGALALQDEICNANRYWVYLHEREEIRRQLGVEPPMPPVNPDEEITETQTKTGEATPVNYRKPLVFEIDDSNVPELLEEGQTTMISRNQTSTTPKEVQEVLEPLPIAPNENDASTAEEVQSVKSPIPETTATDRLAGKRPMVQVLGRIERSSYWQAIAVILLIISIIVMIELIYVLRA